MLTAAQMAALLVNTKALPTGLPMVQILSAESHAYNRLDPYPSWHFRDWKTEDRGPLPRCMPIAKGIVARGARWLFGNPLQIHVPGNETLETVLREAWLGNGMPARLVAMARKAALDGGIVLKFAYDGEAEVPLSIQSLSLVDEVRLYYNPHDRGQLLMARIQYPYQDPETGTTWWHREEWTAQEFIEYVPVAADSLSSGSTSSYQANRSMSPDGFEGWEISSRSDNPFGVIPLTHIKNQETDETWGAGDLWDLYRVFDRVHLTYHLMDKSNQFDAESNPLFIDLDVDADDIDKPLQPGQPIDLKSSEGERQGKVEFPPTGNGLRPAMMEYARDLRKQLLAAASAVEVDQSEFTNKGNLTTAVLMQLFQPQIEMTNEKRKTFGDFGIVAFLQNAARGLQAAGVQLGVTDAPDSYKVNLQWPPYFQMSQEELSLLTTRTAQQEQSGYITHDRAVDRVAQAEGIVDIKALSEELEKEPPPEPDAPPGDKPPAKEAA